VVFSAKVNAGGAGVPTGEVNFMDGSVALGNAVLDASGVAKLSVASLNSGTHSMTAAYAGNRNYESSTSSDMRQIVMGTEGFRLSADPSKLTLSAGSAGKFTITASGLNGFNSAVSLACKSASLPPGASCQFSPASVTPGAKPATSTLTITTSAEAAGLRSPRERPHSIILYAFGLAMPSLVISTLGLGGWSRRKLLWFCALCILIGGCLLLNACGNGGNTSVGNTGAGGSPVTGTYDIVVTGTSATMTQTTTITMNVQ
jgi:hypothetical protein